MFVLSLSSREQFVQSALEPLTNKIKWDIETSVWLCGWCLLHCTVDLFPTTSCLYEQSVPTSLRQRGQTATKEDGVALNQLLNCNLVDLLEVCLYLLVRGSWGSRLCLLRLHSTPPASSYRPLRPPPIPPPSHSHIWPRCVEPPSSLSW